MTDLEKELRQDPRTPARLTIARDAPAAEAAVEFFCYGEPSPNVRWYGSETWRQIMEVIAQLAPVADPCWYDATNNDNGSLRTGDRVPLVGEVIEMEGEGRKRYVTSTMGSPGSYHAHFKFQNEVPRGRVLWRIVASTPHLQADSGSGTPPKPPQSTATDTGQGSPPPPVDLPRPADLPAGEQEEPRSHADRIRQHPVVSLLMLLVAAVVALGSLTDALDKILAFVRKHLGG